MTDFEQNELLKWGSIFSVIAGTFLLFMYIKAESNGNLDRPKNIKKQLTKPVQVDTAYNYVRMPVTHEARVKQLVFMQEIEEN
jgi:hypothetical protein